MSDLLMITINYKEKNMSESVNVITRSGEIVQNLQSILSHIVKQLPPLECGHEIAENARIKKGELYGMEPKGKSKLCNKIITNDLINEIKTITQQDILINEIKTIKQNTKELETLKSKIRGIKKGVRKLCEKEKITFRKDKLPQSKHMQLFSEQYECFIKKTINEFDELCLAVGCKRSFTKMP